LNKYFAIGLLFLFDVTISSCEYDNMELSNSKVIYSRDIEPIIKANCSVTGCHVSGSATGDFSSYSGLKASIVSGKFQKMVFELGTMPPYNRDDLTQKELSDLREWINEGATE
jgi:hypothetical protein